MKRKYTVSFCELINYETEVEADSHTEAIAIAQRNFEEGEFTRETSAQLSNFYALRSDRTYDPAKDGDA